LCGLVWEAWRWPDVGALARENPPTTAFIDRHRPHERAAGRAPRVAWTWAPYGAISPSLKRAVLVAEDIGFFSHRGFEPSSLREAVEHAIETGEPPHGASTITQQLAKNLWLSPSRNPLRKAREAILAASRRYFGKSAAELTDDEAAQLAASLPSPSSWHPGATGRAYRRHVERVRRRMEKAEFLARLI
jgi:monofunctional biosynthetic peptidoglycan transglycosylase